MYWRGNLLWLLGIHCSLTTRHLASLHPRQFSLRWAWWGTHFELFWVHTSLPWGQRRLSTLDTKPLHPPPCTQSKATGIIPSPRSIMSWLFQLSPHFGVPEGLKKQSSEQGLGNLPWDAVSKRAVRAPKAFLGNPKELIHFVREGKKKKNPSLVQELEKTSG